MMSARFSHAFSIGSEITYYLKIDQFFLFL